MTTSVDDLRSALEKAEAAVAQLKDPDLRKAAFSKILDNLLGTSGDPLAGERGAKKGRPRPNAGSVSRSKGGPQARVEELIEAGFFKAPRQFKPVMDELEARGHHLPRTTLSPTLLALCRAKKLRRRKVDGAWEYSNW